MPPYTELPRPEGHIYFDYSPMSPPNWDIVASNIHIFVYRDVKLAMQAMLQATTTIQAQRLEAGTASLFSDYLYFRGQSEITQRLLPTRLRGPRKQPMPRDRFSVDNPPKIKFGGQEFPSHAFSGPPGLDPKDHFGDWYEEVEPIRVNEELAAELSDKELSQRDARERAAVTRAAQIVEVARSGRFPKAGRRQALQRCTKRTPGRIDQSRGGRILCDRRRITTTTRRSDRDVMGH